jgi:AhpD family alkylhydroperoxidase
MAVRLNYAKAFPEGVHQLREWGRAINESGLEAPLIELVKMRASQLNGCAFCLDMHSKDARAAGETEQRLYVLPAWRETDFYTPRERAALAWTEAITNIQSGHASDAVYEEVRKEFSEAELVRLTMAITNINAWNRIAIGFRSEAGTYQVKAKICSREFETKTKRAHGMRPFCSIRFPVLLVYGTVYGPTGARGVRKSHDAPTVMPFGVKSFGPNVWCHC